MGETLQQIRNYGLAREVQGVEYCRHSNLPCRPMKQLLIAFSASLLLLVSVPLHATRRRAVRSGPVLPRIGVRVGVDGPEFYEKASGVTFLARGNNFIRLREVTPGNFQHITFDTDQYDPAGAEAALQRMRNQQYNVVRVFLNDRTIGAALPTPGVDRAYISNVADFLRRATANRLHVVLTPGYYHPDNYNVLDGPTPTDVENVNLVILSAGYVNAWSTYVSDVLRSIKEKAPDVMPTILGVDIRNESAVLANYKPFSLTTGTVTLGDGGTYDMGNAASRQVAVDNNTTVLTSRVVAAIKAVDPEVLTTASVFSPLAVGRSGYDGVAPNPDPRAPLRVAALEQSGLDYLDLHIYPLGPGRQLQEQLASCEIFQSSPVRLPRLLGEYGAFRDYYPTVNAAATGMTQFQYVSCRQYGFKGWLLWTWDAPDREQARLWSAADGLETLLAPVARPDPCVP